MSDVSPEWKTAKIVPHLRYKDPKEAITWLARVFGFRERVRMSGPAGEIYISELQGPGGGILMLSGSSPEYQAYVQRKVPNFHQPQDPGWPNLTHSISVFLDNVDAHYQRAVKEGALILAKP